VNRLCLDTSAYSNFKAGHDRAVTLITQCRAISVPSIVLGELKAGFQLGRHLEKNESELADFLANPAVKVLDVDTDAACNYADIVVDLRKKGTPIPTNDVWIASLAIREGATVLTFDAHFSHIERLAVLRL
jgi:predicted nucleic acid-binding protein